MKRHVRSGTYEIFSKNGDYLAKSGNYRLTAENWRYGLDVTLGGVRSGIELGDLYELAALMMG